MACEWKELELEYLKVYKYTNGNSIGFNWTQNIQAISSLRFKVLIEIIERITDNSLKKAFLSRLNTITTSPNDRIILSESTFSGSEKELFHEMAIDELISLKHEVLKIDDAYDKVLAMIDLGYKLFEKEIGVDFNDYTREIVETINELEEDDMILKSYSYSDLAGLLNNFGKIKESNECLFKAMAVIPLINVFERHEAYTAIGKEVILECKCYLLDFINRHVLETAHELNDDWFDYIGTSQEEMIKSVLLDLRRQENYEKIKDIILNQNYVNKLELFNDYIFNQCSLNGDLTNLKIHLLYSITEKINLDEKNKNNNLEKLAYCFIKTEEIEKSNSIAISICDPYLITKVFARIAIEKIHNDELDLIDYFSQNIIFNDEKFEYYGEIVEYLISIGYDLNKTKVYLGKMTDLVSGKLNNDAFLKKLVRLYGEIQEYTFAYDISRRIWNVEDKEFLKNDVLRNFGKSNDLEFAIEFSKKIVDLWDKSLAMESISGELARQGNIDEALEYAKAIDSELTRSHVLASISTLPAKQGNLEDALSYLNAIISFESENINAMNAIYGELAYRNYYLNDLKTLQLGLQKYALIQLFSKSLPEERIQRLNRTLNIQWAIDIKNSFSAN
jgi:hypothetical protein